jgi:hypothetical protein
LNNRRVNIRCKKWPFLAQISVQINKHLFYSYRNGTMDETLWGSWDKSMFSLICEEASKRVWDEIEPGFGAEFRVHLQGISTDDCASAGL